MGGARRRAGEQLDAIINEIGCSSTTPAHLPAAVELAAVPLDLRHMLAPFEAKLHKPYAKFAGAGGVPLAEQLWPKNVNDALAMIAQEHEPRSVVLTSRSSRPLRRRSPRCCGRSCRSRI